MGPPIELLRYDRNSLSLNLYRCLEADDPYLIDIRRQWGEKLARAFAELPQFSWQGLPDKSRFE